MLRFLRVNCFHCKSKTLRSSFFKLREPISMIFAPKCRDFSVVSQNQHDKTRGVPHTSRFLTCLQNFTKKMGSPLFGSDWKCWKFPMKNRDIAYHHNITLRTRAELTLHQFWTKSDQQQKCCWPEKNTAYITRNCVSYESRFSRTSAIL